MGWRATGPVTQAQLAAHVAAADPHAAAGYVDADGARAAAPVQADRWQQPRVQWPGNDSVDSRVSLVDEDVATCALLARSVGTTAGTYTFDLRKGDGTSPATGTSVLDDGPIDLTELDAGVWTSVAILNNGTEELDAGDELHAWLCSDNGDLAGFDDGVTVLVAFRARS